MKGLGVLGLLLMACGCSQLERDFEIEHISCSGDWPPDVIELSGYSLPDSNDDLKITISIDGIVLADSCKEELRPLILEGPRIRVQKISFSGKIENLRIFGRIECGNKPPVFDLWLREPRVIKIREKDSGCGPVVSLWEVTGGTRPVCTSDSFLSCGGRF